MALPILDSRVGSGRSVEHEKLDDVVIRFAGDSGDGMQLTGSQFTNTSALLGNDLATFPDFPAEIRAPQGTLAGVSAFQVRIADYDIHTPGDAPDVLVAMNPAALKVNLKDLKPNGALIVNLDEFDERNLKKAGFDSNPLEDDSLAKYRLFKVELTTLTRRALEDSGLDAKSQERCKNFFALGMAYWMFSRPIEGTIQWLEKKFAAKPQLAAANIQVMKAGFNYCDITELFHTRYEIEPAKLPAGVYRNITGGTAMALGFVAASRKCGLPLFQGAYPITPASDLLHELAMFKNFGVTTFQAEDEIAAVCAAIGAAFGGALAITSTSGPGLALKSEAMNLAVMVELPLVVIDVQRGGPSTGLPTKTEQADLLQAMFGRNNESPLPVIAASSPADCFARAIEACRIAIRHMTPVVLLSDGYIANGSEPWRLPESADLPDFGVEFHTRTENFLPYLRDPQTLARPWAIPGTPGLEHRIGGIEKSGLTGDISYAPQNHHEMTLVRKARVDGIVQDVPDLEVSGPAEGDLLLLGWGGTYGAITSAGQAARKKGLSVATAHLRYLNPFPANLEKVLRSYKKVIIPELNTGQLSLLIRGKFLIDAIPFNKISGQPFKIVELEGKIDEVLGRSGPYVIEFGHSSAVSGG